jgi:hypothetical protein
MVSLSYILECWANYASLFPLYICLAMQHWACLKNSNRERQSHYEGIVILSVATFLVFVLVHNQIS